MPHLMAPWSAVRTHLSAMTQAPVRPGAGAIACFAAFTARVCMDAKDTNQGKGCSGNVCHGGHTPFAALSRTDQVILAANNPPFSPGRNSFQADWLRCRSAQSPPHLKLKRQKE